MTRRFAVIVSVLRLVRATRVAMLSAGVLLFVATPAPGAPSSDGPWGRHAAKPKCLGVTATIVGSNRADSRGRKIVGTRRADVIVSRGGADDVRGRGGADLICGGPGGDRVDGGPGADRIVGGAGPDRVSGGTGDDVLSGNAGADRIDGGLGIDRCRGGKGIDRLLACDVPIDIVDPLPDPTRPISEPAGVQPIAAPDAATTSEDAAVTVAVLGNDTDPDGDPLTLSGVDAGAVEGAVSIVGDTIVYDPAGAFDGLAAGASVIETFSYSVGDGATAPVSGAVTVTVTGADDPPRAVNDIAELDEDAGPVSIDILANDTDVDAGPKRAVGVVDAGAHGTVSLAADGTGLTYTPDPDYCNSSPMGSPDTFTYSLEGGSSATVTVTVTCVGDAPVAADDQVTTAEDTPLVLPHASLLANDADADGESLSVTAVNGAVNGVVGTGPGASEVTFSPLENFCGAASFDYTINDGSTEDTGTVTVTVTCVNDGPIAVDDSTTTAQDTPTDVSVLANDIDVEGDPLAVMATHDATNGTAVVEPGGGYVTFTPAAGFCGSASFGYTVSDGSVTDTGAVSVTVNCG